MAIIPRSEWIYSLNWTEPLFIALWTNSTDGFQENCLFCEWQPFIVAALCSYAKCSINKFDLNYSLFGVCSLTVNALQSRWHKLYWGLQITNQFSNTSHVYIHLRSPVKIEKAIQYVWYFTVKCGGAPKCFTLQLSKSKIQKTEQENVQWNQS